MTRRPSVRRTLVAWLAAGLLLALVAAAYFTYQRARDEANELFDLQLQQTAASIIGVPLDGGVPLATHGSEGLVVQIWDRRGVRLYLSRPPSADSERMPQRSTPGFATIDTPSGLYRVFSVVANEQLVQVGQPIAVRRELAARLALSTILPLALLTPLIALFVWIAIRRGLAPLHRVAAAVKKRSPGQLAPIDSGGWPSEVSPLIDALNGLLGRLDRALDAQRAFVADAAHELRSPLAALALQVQLAQRAVSPDERDRALSDLRDGLSRATRVVEQLLALAREEPGVAQRPLVEFDVAEVARDVVAARSPLAAEKSIDLGVARADTLRVLGDRDAIATLLANLVDNAIRYTPSGGRIDVLVAAIRGGEIAVRDNGPGIPADERARAFERFARGRDADAPGSGLGLAIVKRIAERHGATVDLGAGLDGRGLGVTVRFGGRGNA
jgi:two-component system OmpR family sensor kinase